ncbi:Peptidase-S15 domain-containing protein [Mycena chlorophos]|uniref:Peptidase-S15 domain-containing protein n=1 Tax=Mycena chlorophos TaxID=658473 RepID=A0A8H6WM04_MYCCL|nr:Peptidase-S15 domain-containing protein [Mycena chlorophos]
MSTTTPPPPPPTHHHSTVTVRIPSLTFPWTLEAWVYTPQGTSLHPVVVMYAPLILPTNPKLELTQRRANGLGCTKRLGLASYAAAFAEAGYACVVFDYRRWGGSDGTPRNCVIVEEQQEDYRTVVKWVRQQALEESGFGFGFDGQRIAIWGFSFAGGHVLKLSADPTLALRASIALNPYCGRPFPPLQLTRLYLMRFLLGALDFAAEFLGLRPVYIPTVGPPGSLAALSAPGAEAGFVSVMKDDADFVNQMNASIFFRAPLHSRPAEPASLRAIAHPILLLAARGDRICPHARIIAAAEGIREGLVEVLELDGGAFEFFLFFSFCVGYES